MKITNLLPILFLFLSFIGFAQKNNFPKNSFKYGYATTYLKTGDYIGKLQYLEFNRSIFKPLSIGFIGSRTKANKFLQNGFEQKTLAFQGDANLYLHPINNSVNSLKLGGGVIFRKMDYSFRVPPADSIDVPWQTNTSEQIGFSASLEYEVFVAKHIILGSKAAFQQFENKDRVYYWGLNLGVRF